MSISHMGRGLCVLSAFAACTLAATASSAQEDEARFRGGVNAAVGGIFGSESIVSYSGFLGGVDGRFGVQINNLIGVYAQPQLAFGSVSAEIDSPFASGASASEGWLAFSGTALADFTFIDQIFVGAGGGFAAHAPTCTNCEGLTGPVLHFRVGGYPLMGKGDNGIRRQGLMVGGDMRVNFLSNGPLSITMLQPMFVVGYEAY